MKISKIVKIVTSEYLKIIVIVQNSDNIYLFSIQIFKLNQFLCIFKYLVLYYSFFMFYIILFLNFEDLSIFGFLLKNM